jgi:biopolymer transport protein ExbD
MTPMVDVVLCLLVFFMAATRLYDWDENEFTVKVPEVADAAPLTSAPDDLSLTVLAPNKIALKDKTLDLETLTQTLIEARKRYADQGVMIRGDGKLSYQDLADVLSACNTAGAGRCATRSRSDPLIDHRSSASILEPAWILSAQSSSGSSI